MSPGTWPMHSIFEHPTCQSRVSAVPSVTPYRPNKLSAGVPQPTWGAIPAYPQQLLLERSEAKQQPAPKVPRLLTSENGEPYTRASHTYGRAKTGAQASVRSPAYTLLKFNENLTCASLSPASDMLPPLFGSLKHHSQVTVVKHRRHMLLPHTLFGCPRSRGTYLVTWGCRRCLNRMAYPHPAHWNPPAPEGGGCRRAVRVKNACQARSSERRLVTPRKRRLNSTVVASCKRDAAELSSYISTLPPLKSHHSPTLLQGLHALIFPGVILGCCAGLSSRGHLLCMGGTYTMHVQSQYDILKYLEAKNLTQAGAKDALQKNEYR